ISSRHELQSARRVRWAISPPEGTWFQAIGDAGGPMVVSPDGSRLAFSALDAAGKTQLWVRSLDALQASPLQGTEGASWPFWSPAGRALGFFAHGQLKRIDVEGGPAINLCDVRVARGGTWGKDGSIVFARHVEGSLYRVAASGGAAVSVTQVDTSHQDTH